VEWILENFPENPLPSFITGIKNEKRVDVNRESEMKVKEYECENEYEYENEEPLIFERGLNMRNRNKKFLKLKYTRLE
jgi:hypothetical protein